MRKTFYYNYINEQNLRESDRKISLGGRFVFHVVGASEVEGKKKFNKEEVKGFK